MIKHNISLENKWSVIAYLCPCFQPCCGLQVPESSCAASPFTRVIELWWKRKDNIGNHLLKENDNLSQALLEIVMRKTTHRLHPITEEAVACRHRPLAGNLDNHTIITHLSSFYISTDNSNETKHSQSGQLLENLINFSTHKKHWTVKKQDNTQWELDQNDQGDHTSVKPNTKIMDNQ